MNKYECIRCGFVTNLRGNFKRHLNRKFICMPKKNDIPINKVIALTLSIKKVKGKVKVINIVVVKPGIEPTTMPRKTPMKRRNIGHN